ncbi:MAG: hypothetical protein RLZZ618_1665 [Pseudomonadota bacterium]|jgi:EpsD family peptidyl-prolyl cis-trans isomerase
MTAPDASDPTLTRAPLRTALTALTAAVLLSACGKSQEPAATQIAARVNKEEISVHQVNFMLQRQPGVKADQVETASRQILESLIDQSFAVQQAEAMKLDREPQVQQALAAARREILARTYAERSAATVAKPTPEAITAYYDSKPALFSQRRAYSLQELQVQADADMLKALRERVQTAKSGQEVTDFIKTNKLPARGSQNTTTSENLPPPLVDRFAQLKEGQAVFLPGPGGARIVLVAAAQPAPLTREQAQPVIEQILTRDSRQQFVATELKTLREAGKVEYLGKFAEKPGSAASAPVKAPTMAAAAASAAASGALDNDTIARGMGALK